MLMSRMTVFVLVVFGWISPVLGQDLVRQCTDISEQGGGMAIVVDEVGTIHVAHAARVSGTLRYSRVAPDGSTANEVVANRIHRFPTSDTLGVGLALSGDEVLICYHNQAARGFALHSSQTVLDTDVIEGNTGDGCGVGEQRPD